MKRNNTVHITGYTEIITAYLLCGLEINENYHVLVNQFHGNFRSKTLSYRKIRCVFGDVK